MSKVFMIVFKSAAGISVDPVDFIVMCSAGFRAHFYLSTNI